MSLVLKDNMLLLHTMNRSQYGNIYQLVCVQSLLVSKVRSVTCTHAAVVVRFYGVANPDIVHASIKTVWLNEARSTSLEYFLITV